MRPGGTRVPVQKSEGEEAGLLQRRTGQLPPEREEGLMEVHALPAELTLEATARPDTQGILGEVSHRQREAMLAAVATVEAAHRYAHRPSQIRGVHVVVPATRQHPRRLAHRIGAHLLNDSHAPSPSPPSPGDCSLERTFLPRSPVYRVGLTWRVGRAGGAACGMARCPACSDPTAQVGWTCRPSRPGHREVQEGEVSPRKHSPCGSALGDCSPWET